MGPYISSFIYKFDFTGKTNNEYPKAKTPKKWIKDDKKYGVHRVKNIQLHKGFIQGIWLNDLAIITVKKPFKFDHITGYTPLASGNSSNGNDFQIHNIL